MIDILKRFFKNSFVRVTGLNGLLMFFQSAIAIFSTKFVAVIIGAEGVAMLGQLKNLMQVGTLISSGGFNQGITKYVAEKKSNKRVLEYIATSLVVVVLLTLLAAIVIIVFSKTISMMVFNSSVYKSIIIIFAVLLIFVNLNGIVLAVVNGLQNYKLYFKLNILVTIVSFLLTITLVYTFKIYGALLALVLTQAVVFFISMFFVDTLRIRYIRIYKFFSSEKAKKLLQYSLITIGASILWPIVNIAIRSYLITYLDASKAGIWQATRNINDYITSIAIGGFSVYLLPKLSSIKNRQLLKKQLISIYKIIVPAVLLSFIVLYVCRDLVVRILYTKEFLQVSDLLFLQMVGTFFWLCKVPIMNGMLAKGMTKLYFVNELFFAFMYVVLCAYLIPRYEIQGIQLAYAIYNFLYFLVNLVIIWLYISESKYFNKIE